jgi:hypothetical protein
MCHRQRESYRSGRLAASFVNLKKWAFEIGIEKSPSPTSYMRVPSNLPGCQTAEKF